MEVLSNKTYKTYDKQSRYQSFPVYFHTLDHKYVQGTDAWLRSDTPYTNHIVANGDTFDSLALYYYNTPTYYWIICSFNNIIDPFQKLVVGTTIKIPALSNIEFVTED